MANIILYLKNKDQLLQQIFVDRLMSGFHLLEHTGKGIYCNAGGFYIDPWHPVEKALITHAHSDHAKPGMKKYLAHKDTVPILKLRLGEDINVQAVEYGEGISINGVKVSFHPSGHIVGSAQIRLEYQNEVWVVSGDYKTEYDGISPAFEPIKCNVFVTESTFGLPIYQWKPQEQVFGEINNWWRENREEGRSSILCGYPLGKAQRLLYNIDPSIGKIYAHGSMLRIYEAFKEIGVKLPDMEYADLNMPKGSFAGALVIAPPGVTTSSWIKRFEPYSSAIASGWMNLRGAKRRSAADVGFVLSDHADWQGLNEAVEATGAEKVIVTHGYTSSFARWLGEKGYETEEWLTEWEGEMNELQKSEEE